MFFSWFPPKIQIILLKSIGKKYSKVNLIMLKSEPTGARFGFF